MHSMQLTARGMITEDSHSFEDWESSSLSTDVLDPNCARINSTANSAKAK